jgi:TRAP-type C4-dicarboxylate transport system substrate-binding protein
MKKVLGAKNPWPWKRFLAVVIVPALIWGLQSLPAKAEEPIKARLSYHWFPQHHAAIYADKFAKACEEATDGKLKVEVFPSGQLFGIREVLPAVVAGSVEMAGVLDLNFAAVDRSFMIDAFGYFWDGYQKERDFWEKDPVAREHWEGIQKRLGIKVLCYVPVGPSCMFTTRKIDGTVEGLKGLKTRYLSLAEKPAYTALGMSMVSVGTSEVFTALKQGMIDTVTTNPSALKAYSWWDYLKYGYKPYVGYSDAYIVANAKWWNGLPAGVQQVILSQVSPKIGREATDTVITESDAVLKEFQEEHGGVIMTMSDAEVKKLIQIYREKVWPVIGKGMDPKIYEAAFKFMGFK